MARHSSAVRLARRILRKGGHQGLALVSYHGGVAYRNLPYATASERLRIARMFLQAPAPDGATMTLFCDEAMSEIAYR